MPTAITVSMGPPVSKLNYTLAFSPTNFRLARGKGGFITLLTHIHRFTNLRSWACLNLNSAVESATKSDLADSIAVF